MKIYLKLRQFLRIDDLRKEKREATFLSSDNSLREMSCYFLTKVFYKKVLQRAFPSRKSKKLGKKKLQRHFKLSEATLIFVCFARYEYYLVQISCS